MELANCDLYTYRYIGIIANGTKSINLYYMYVHLCPLYGYLVFSFFLISISILAALTLSLTSL